MLAKRAAIFRSLCITLLGYFKLLPLPPPQRFRRGRHMREGRGRKWEGEWGTISPAESPARRSNFALGGENFPQAADCAEEEEGSRRVDDWGRGGLNFVVVCNLASQRSAYSFVFIRCIQCHGSYMTLDAPKINNRICSILWAAIVQHSRSTVLPLPIPLF